MTAEVAEVIGKRYQLRRKLGEGGMGAVYVAYDRLMKQEVALKRMRPPGTNQTFEFSSDMAAFHLALAREFKVLASLRHPHIISVLDYGFEEVDTPEGRQPYFTMELLANARPFVEAAMHTEVLDQQIALIAQLLQALAYLHRCGILHRDLKPGNLLVNVNGQLKVLDFGVAMDVRTESDEPMGTLLYMAPEVISGGRASKASDLYAVGVMLYELITGQHPFPINNFTQLLEAILTLSPDLTPIPDAPLEEADQSPLWNQSAASTPNYMTILHRRDDATRPAEVTQPIPSDDSAPTLISHRQLVPPTVRLPKPEQDDNNDDNGLSEETQQFEAHPESEERPTLRQIITRLLAKSPTDRYQDAYSLLRDLCAAVGATVPQETIAIRESFLQAAAFVGRKTELNQLETALVQATFNQGSAWLVGGESGIGKSRLLDELRTRALIQGVLVLRGQTVAEGGAPYQLWRDPLRRLVLSTDLDDLDAAILKGVLPDMDDLTGRPIKQAAVLTGTDFQKRLNGAIVSLFARQTQPILLLLEDLQWASDETLEVLNMVTGLCNDHPLLIVGSFRVDDAPTLNESLPGMTLLKLERLSREHVAELSASILGAMGQMPVVVEMLLENSEGNAYFIIETVRALAEEVGRMDALDSRRLPRTLLAGGIQQVIQRRLNRVPDWAQRLLRLAAVAGRELDLALIRHLAAGVDVEAWLATCANCAVLEIQDQQWHFTHDKLREGILGALEAAVRADLHRQVAEGIEAVYPDDPQQAAALAGHWHSAWNARSSSMRGVPENMGCSFAPLKRP